MSNHQPTPFEFKNGVLLDAHGEPVNLTSQDNLKAVAEAFEEVAASRLTIAVMEDEICDLENQENDIIGGL